MAVVHNVTGAYSCYDSEDVFSIAMQVRPGPAGPEHVAPSLGFPLEEEGVPPGEGMGCWACFAPAASPPGAGA